MATGTFLGEEINIFLNMTAIPPDAETANGWSCTSYVPSAPFMACNGQTFTFNIDILKSLTFRIFLFLTDGKYHMLPSGELMILNITASDAMRSYRCRTHHLLTQEAVVSRNVGRIQMTGE